ncbi:MAG: hypothetical protein ACFFD4_33100 [Candidatus Odinarchaeota archaeon]
MVNFCECGGLLLPKGGNNGNNQKKTFSCSNCGRRKDLVLNGHYTVNISLVSEVRKTVVIENENSQHLPVIERECPKCHHATAFYLETLDNKAEEYERTLTYCCTGCHHVFRQ